MWCEWVGVQDREVPDLLVPVLVCRLKGERDQKPSWDDGAPKSYRDTEKGGRCVERLSSQGGRDVHKGGCINKTDELYTRCPAAMLMCTIREIGARQSRRKG